MRFRSLMLSAATVVAVVLGASPRPTHGAQAEPAPAKAADASAGGRVFEMRKYYAMPGKLDALNARFRDHTTKLFEKHRMENVGYWVITEGPEANQVLVYILAYPSKEAKEAAWKGFRADPDWKKAREESEKDGKIVQKVESTILKATDYSAIK